MLLVTSSGRDCISLCFGSKVIDASRTTFFFLTDTEIKSTFGKVKVSLFSASCYMMLYHTEQCLGEKKSQNSARLVTLVCTFCG